MMGNKAFVYVVCGSREHIDTLNFSLKYLSHFSEYPIYVVTDSRRNELPIAHDKIIDIPTSDEYDHHQASIALKTKLQNIMPPGNTYCYLDSDIVAIDHQINSVFKHFKPPVTFASDHCPINQFSPHAVNCNCIERQKEYVRIMNEIIYDLDIRKVEEKKRGWKDHQVPKTQRDIHRKQLHNYFERIKNKPLANFKEVVMYVFNQYVLKRDFTVENIFHFSQEDKCWYDDEGNLLLFDYRKNQNHDFWDQYKLKYDKKQDAWLNKNGEPIDFGVPKCTHLNEYLKEKYDVNIPEKWQHWNGGVFIFDDKSKTFLDFWHKATIEEFRNPYTKTRDQGTLAMSVWKHHLEAHPRLPREFNFIAEYENPDIAYRTGLGYTYDNFRSQINPHFLHVYHEWGHKGWSIWDSILELGKKENILD